VACVAAESGRNIEELRETLLKAVKKRHLQIYPNYLHNETYDMSKYNDFDK